MAIIGFLTLSCRYTYLLLYQTLLNQINYTILHMFIHKAFHIQRKNLRKRRVE